MIYGISMILALVAFCLGCRLFLVYRAIRSIKKQLTEIAGEQQGDRNVKLPLPDKQVEELVAAINEQQEFCRQNRIVCEKKEQQLKEQIENISHDLRTPLTAIQGYLKLLEMDKLTVEEKEYLEVVLRKSDTLQSLIGQFYELSRVEAKEFSLPIEEVNVARLLRESCLENYGEIEKQKLELELSVQEDVVNIIANEDALKRIFSNLLQNALRYAKSTLWIELARSEGEVCIRFQNDLDGEAPGTDANQLFERFYVQEKSRTRGGTGLGLTISKDLAEHMGGRLTAEYGSRDGRDCLTFQLVFVVQ